MSNSEVLVRAENVSKKFCRRLKRALWYGMNDLTSELLGRSNRDNELRMHEFWAVKDVSFELRRGECLGLIGRNGAGKSTLLKMLNGLIKPDKGRMIMRGRVGALIELGAGFNPILTGRENIYVNAAVLGIPKQEVDKKLDSIIEFAEIKDFIDTPVQHYSSGMKVRLGFAVAAQLEPDVLIIDEVLAVGDVGFRAKCFSAIHKIMQRAAVILVTHSMPQVSRVCSDIMVMNHGKSEFQGKDIPKGIDIFYSRFQGEEAIVAGSGRALIHRVELESNGQKGIEQVDYLDELSIHIDATIPPDVKNPNIGVLFVNPELQNVAQCSSQADAFEAHNSGEKMHFVLKLDKICFNPGTYSIAIAISEENRREVLVRILNAKSFRVAGHFVAYAPLLLQGDWRVTT